MKKISILLSLVCCLFLCSCKNPVNNKTSVSELNEEQNEIYNRFVSEISNYNNNIVFENENEDDITAAYSEVVKTHPEFFWISTGYSINTLTEGKKKTITFSINITDDNSAIKSKKDELDVVVQEIISKVDSSDNDFEKLLYIHDYIIDNTDYDFINYDKIMNSNDVIFDSSTAYGCLCKKTAVCSGYSAAMQLLLSKLGIECGRITGTKIGGGGHEWNYVKLDGDYYYLDVTWDDPQSESGNSNNKTYEFFCVTSDEILKNHTIDNNQFIPECSANKYNYYVYKKMFLKNYSFEEYKKMFAVNNTVKFGSEEEAKKAENDLITNKRIFEIINSKNVSYSKGVTGTILTIN